MMQQSLERAILFGLAAGMRTTAPLVACAEAERPWQWYLLLSELVVDKFPCMPSRLQVGAWLGRVGTAGYAAFHDAQRRKSCAVQSVGVAALTAGLATKLAHDLRQSLTRSGRWPDYLVALIEDALMLACVVRLRDTEGMARRE